MTPSIYFPQFLPDPKIQPPVEKKTENKLGGGLRHDEGKTNYHLLEPFAQEQKARIFTKGKNKYAANNWLKGMPWSKMLDCAKRHIAAYEKGEDYDFYPDNCQACKEGNCTNHTGELHAAQAAWNLDAIVSFYKWYPQGDDRLHHIMPKPKIGLDIDEVICNWVDAWCELYDLPKPTAWYFDGNIVGKFENMRKAGTLDSFYANLKPLINPCDIHFEPHCYITSRPVDSDVTVRWLHKNGFPVRPVLTVGAGESKVEVAKQAGIDIFVDDRYDNYEELNRAGICCYLMDAPHNKRYNVGYRRIKSLKELAL